MSLAPSVTRDLYQLNLQDKLIGVTMYCPTFAKGKENLGSILAPDIERIATLKPDLVIITKEGNNIRTLNKLQSIGINVYVTGNVDNFNDICRDFIKLGDYLGKGEKARDIVADSRERIAALKDISRAKRLRYSIRSAPTRFIRPATKVSSKTSFRQPARATYFQTSIQGSRRSAARK